VILNIGLDEAGCPLIYYYLYDSTGRLVARSEVASSFPDGLKVQTSDGEVLLELPVGTDAPIQYRLYNRTGALLTSSDGVSTKIEPGLRMETRPQGGKAALTPWYRYPA
jgi:hypothetical protein